MGLVGQLPRTLFGLIFERMDDRDRGACAFLGEVLQSWDKRRCFSKRWLQDAASKFAMPKGPNAEKDEGKGWYALTAENIHKKILDDKPPAPQAKEKTADEPEAVAPKEKGKDKESRRRSRSRRRDRDSSPRAREPPAPAPKPDVQATAPPQREAPVAAPAPAPEVREAEMGTGGPTADEALERLVAKEREADKDAANRTDKTGKKKRGVVQDEDDDDTVKKHLEESRKRRAALLAKYK
uniref:Uncharacterized protein n=1 Tax=Alexandrium catenella TaxID=2925 RepID=A0A7S1SCM5_ALECA|mmetsp:Transcript_94954/g.252131  ORF Transcript_94954/g.252131 Transcript_94954/m.252131 type:complete len:239 (+) Transcript_94954:652-1368(+)